MANQKKLITALIVLFSGLTLSGCGPVYPQELHTAITEGDIDTVRTMLAEKPELVNPKRWRWGSARTTPLQYAIRYGHNDLSKFLIANGANVDSKDSADWTALHFAGRYEHREAGGNKEIVELLIAQGAQVNAKDGREQTPLHIAAKYGNKDAVELLVANGANVNSMDEQGESPLNKAILTVPPKAKKMWQRFLSTTEQM